MGVSRGCLRDVSRMSERVFGRVGVCFWVSSRGCLGECLGDVWGGDVLGVRERCYRVCLGDVWGCQKNVWGVYGRCLEDIFGVSGHCIAVLVVWGCFGDV